MVRRYILLLSSERMKLNQKHERKIHNQLNSASFPLPLSHRRSHIVNSENEEWRIQFQFQIPIPMQNILIVLTLNSPSFPYAASDAIRAPSCASIMFAGRI